MKAYQRASDLERVCMVLELTLFSWDLAAFLSQRSTSDCAGPHLTFYEQISFPPFDDLGISMQMSLKTEAIYLFFCKESADL